MIEIKDNEIYTVNGFIVKGIIARSASANYQYYKNISFCFFIVGFSIMINYAVSEFFVKISKPTPIWIHIFLISMIVISIVGYVWAMRRCSMKHFLEKEVEFFNNILFTSTVKTEINNMLEDLN